MRGRRPGLRDPEAEPPSLRSFDRSETFPGCKALETNKTEKFSEHGPIAHPAARSYDDAPRQ